MVISGSIRSTISDLCSFFPSQVVSLNLVHIIFDMRTHVYTLHRAFQSFIDKLPEQLPVEWGRFSAVTLTLYTIAPFFLTELLARFSFSLFLFNVKRKREINRERTVQVKGAGLLSTFPCSFIAEPGLQGCGERGTCLA